MTDFTEVKKKVDEVLGAAEELKQAISRMRWAFGELTDDELRLTREIIREELVKRNIL